MRSGGDAEIFVGATKLPHVMLGHMYAICAAGQRKPAIARHQHDEPIRMADFYQRAGKIGALWMRIVTNDNPCAARQHR